MRRSGILLPISSLPSKYGIGSFSKKAYKFVDFLEKAGQSYWQILPLGPTGFGDSPYQSFSTFAGNPYYIDLDALADEGLITAAECGKYDFGGEDESIDYSKLYAARFKILHAAYKRSNIRQNAEFKKFIEESSFWLDDYALFMALKEFFGGKSFVKWDEKIKKRNPEALKSYSEKLTEEIEFYQFQQFQFTKQWKLLKKYANEKNIEIIGDIPIYVAFDSADTWANPELFQFDEELTPIAVAGCPPDAFSSTGQLWGNPLYRWEYHKKTDYAWWMQRIAYSYQLYDVLRIDHFRGFDEYYAIPFGNPTAEYGKWKKGPGFDFFKTMKAKLGEKRVIAEDLGFLTPGVLKLVKETGYPGMKILQFAFDSREESDYLPHNYTENSVVYTGTHDNDTAVGWYQVLNKRDKKYADKYLDLRHGRDTVWTFIRAALSSVSATAIIPMQDYLELGSEARMNTPSTLGKNWKWRMNKNSMHKDLAKRIRELTQIYGRLYTVDNYKKGNE